jgi:hypothetical protein
LTSSGLRIPGQAPGVILLDTSALIWVDAGHAGRVRCSTAAIGCTSPPHPSSNCSFCTNPRKMRLRNHAVEWVVHDDRWLVDEPPAGSWFLRAAEIGWTRDPFDRLLVAHAQVRRWRLATADARILEHLGPATGVEL